MKILLPIAFIITTFQASATNYYLSDRGDDLQSGTSPIAAWRSLKKLSEAAQLLKPGDSILFEKGSIFAGELRMIVSGKLDQDIYVGAYGSGAKPIVLGSLEVKNWTVFRDNIWVADCIACAAEPGNLFIDGQYQPLGRYPNEGYMTLSCNSNCKATLTDSHHEFADGYWNGAEVVVKSSRWTLDNLPVVNYFNTTFYFSAPASYPLPDGYGYFIQRHVETLDRPGEWFFDKTANKIFLYCRNSDNPGNHRVEVSVTDLGIEISNSAFLTIENIVFRRQRKSGVQINKSRNISMRNCDVEYSGNNGMEIKSCQSPLIEHCHVMDSNNNGVEWNDNANGKFTGNFIHRTGLRPGRGIGGNGTYIGLNITAADHQTGKNNLFQFNSVDSTGYLGIDFRTGGTVIKNNVVSNFCMVKDDGAGIYTWGNTFGGNKIEGNIVLHGIGNGNGTNAPDQSWVSGIYIDDRSAAISIDSNTVAYCGTNGIYIHNARRISIHGNTLFGNGTNLTNRENAQLCIKRDALVPTVEGEPLDLQISENQLVTLQENNHCVLLLAESEQGLRGLEFNKNSYWAPDSRLVIARLFNHQEMCRAMEDLTLPEWLQAGCDQNSQFELIDELKGFSNQNLVLNSRMSNNTEGWVIWPAQVSIEHDKKTGVNPPSLRVLFPRGESEALLYYAGIGLSNNKWYRLIFWAKSAAKNKIEFSPLMASSPWGALGDYACFSLDTDFKSFTYVFRPNKSSRNARLNFRCNAAFWIDNVTLSEVKLTMGSAPVKLFYNTDEATKTLALPEEFKGINGTQAGDKLVLEGYGSRILRRKSLNK